MKINERFEAYRKRWRVRDQESLIALYEALKQVPEGSPDSHVSRRLTLNKANLRRSQAGFSRRGFVVKEFLEDNPRVSISEVVKALGCERCFVISIVRRLYPIPYPWMSRRSVEITDTKDEVNAVLDRYSPEERRVLEQNYIKERRLKDIAKEWGKSEWQVSQIRKRALGYAPGKVVDK